MRPRIKICCIANIDEARLAMTCGASALGLVSAMPSGPGVIDDLIVAEIAAWAPPGVATFLLTCLQRGVDIVEQVRRCRVNTVQLCDAVEPSEYAVIRREIPAVKIVQVIHVGGEASIADARIAAQYVDAILLDSGNPALAIKELGGTGRVHNWAISRRIRDSIDKPVFLAGGLTAENVRQAIAAVGPYGVDVCSGVRTNGRLNEEKLKRFVEEIERVSSQE